jgi:hypothetical protein
MGTYIKDVIGKLSWVSEREELSVDLFEFYHQLHPLIPRALVKRR